tara:strand:- start:5117 stop:5566 length:450 start_codon:yes stop_codon:yes gene_type:complete
LNNVVKFSSKSNVFVRPIIEDEIEEFLPKIISIIKPAIDKSQRNVSIDDVIEDIMTTRSLMWAVYIGDTLSAAFTTSIAEHPQRRTLFIEFMGGVAMAAWMRAALRVLKELAKKSKLDGIEAHGRIGFSKMAKEHGFKEVYRHFEMELA